MIEQPSLAILIDCWATETEHSKNLYNRIVNFLDTSPQITTVLLASYNCREEKRLQTVWHNNYDNVFINNNPGRVIIDLEFIHRSHVERDRQFPKESTDPIILNYYNPTKFQMSMLWGWELQYYLSMHPEIKNIYVLGGAWSNCVRVRPLGYEALSEFKNINVLTDTSCIGEMKGVKLVIGNDWTQITDTTYFLNKY